MSFSLLFLGCGMGLPLKSASLLLRENISAVLGTGPRTSMLLGDVLGFDKGSADMGGFSDMLANRLFLLRGGFGGTFGFCFCSLVSFGSSFGIGNESPSFIDKIRNMNYFQCDRNKCSITLIFKLS